jgi:hypothetical protein
MKRQIFEVHKQLLVHLPAVVHSTTISTLACCCPFNSYSESLEEMPSRKKEIGAKRDLESGSGSNGGLVRLQEVEDDGECRKLDARGRKEDTGG